MSLQSRLTLITLALFVPIVSVFIAGVYFISRDRIYASVDQTLSSRTRAVEVAISHSFGPLTPADIDLGSGDLARQALDGTVFQIFSPRGVVIFASSADGILPDSSIGVPDVGLSTRQIGGARTRIRVSPVVRLGSVVGYVEVRTSLDGPDGSIAAIRRASVFGALLVALATVVPTYIVAGRAISPVNEVARWADEIEETADFSRRVPPVRSPREVSRLAVAFNRMIRRVEQMITAQRAFLADSSHELRRPLTILTTNLAVPKRPGLSQTDRDELVGEMSEEVARMNRLISDLVILAREGTERIGREPFDLSVLCERAVEHVAVARPNHAFVSRVGPGIHTVGDPERLTLALENLLQNAANYTQDGGRVTLELRRGPHGPIVSVSDNGRGMSQEDIERAFERFYRGSAARGTPNEGLGLGLAIVKRIVDVHDGAIWIDSEVGRGTTVTIELRDPTEHPEPDGGAQS